MSSSRKMYSGSKKFIVEIRVKNSRDAFMMEQAVEGLKLYTWALGLVYKSRQIFLREWPSVKKEK